MEVSIEQQQKLERVASTYHLTLILLFGSVLSGKQHLRSDLDIAVLYERQKLQLKEYSDLMHDLHEIFPDLDIDLASINHADPLFLKKVTENCQVLYGDIRRLQALKIYAFKRYQDHRRYFEMERKYVVRFLKERAVSK
ncbi:MAG TPA: nucleotidyltransferase domain-containing protein [Nitrospirota bacterium]|nr:nucleotidyltransferase domain-containing protein [Nitrospirota bacterium]